jgi:hypothetical protein
VFGTDILRIEELEPAKQIHDRIFEALDLDRETLAKTYGGTAARLLRLQI